MTTISDAGAHHRANGRPGPAADDITLALLRLVRASRFVSRADIARRFGVHRSTVTDIVRPLLAEGLLRETETAAAAGETRMGRPATGLKFTDELYCIGFSLGVRQSHAGAVTVGGRLLAEASFDTPRDKRAALRLMRSAVADLRAGVRGRKLVSVGVSVPGPTCAEHRVLLCAPHLGWRDVSVANALRFRPGIGARFRGISGARDVPVIVENDARAAALYEARIRPSGTDDDWSDFILVRAGSGIGVGVVRGGELYRGAKATEGWAGEFGHMTIVAGGRPCACGGQGCWESYASAGSAEALYAGDRAAARGRAPEFVEIVEHAEGGEARARETLCRVGGYLGIGIANLISGLGVSRVVVSGRLVRGWKFLTEAMHEAVGKSMAGRFAEWTVVPGGAAGAGLGGALEVAIDHYLTAGRMACGRQDSSSKYVAQVRKPHSADPAGRHSRVES
jgi:predicted NBD/HSP70 family sugar kinase